MMSSWGVRKLHFSQVSLDGINEVQAICDVYVIERNKIYESSPLSNIGSGR